MRPNQAYDLIDPETGDIYPFNPNRVWAFIPESMERMINEKRIYFPKDINKRPYQKRFFNELKNKNNPLSSVIFDSVGLNTEATRLIQSILNANIFDYSKPMSLLNLLISQIESKDSIILDFFSGSSTTAHSVMQLNAEDDGNRKFIMVQLPEITDIKSEAYKAGYKNICEIGKERIRRAGKKIKEENSNKENINKLDTGFRVLKLDSSNMEDVYYIPSDYNQTDLFSQTENVKSDRTAEDLLFQVMLELGATLDSKIEKLTIEDKTIYNVAKGFLIACFDDEITEDVVKSIAKMQPAYAVMRDRSMKDDSIATNFEQIFKTYSPNTITKIL